MSRARIFLTAFAAIPLFLVAAEGLLRLNSWARQELFLRDWIGPEQARPGMLELSAGMNHRLLSVFPGNPPADYLLLNGQRNYVNNRWQEPNILTEIYPYAKLPPSIRIQTENFLLSPELGRLRAFSVSTNSLGFRDPERPARNKNTRRILVLGAYQTFGFGVNDDDAYPRVTEKILNGPKGKYRYEVWNAGLLTSTAIKGLALLHGDMEAIAPDLVVLDYGLMDAVLTTKNPLLSWPEIFFSPGGKVERTLAGWNLRLLASGLNRSYLFSLFTNYLTTRNLRENIVAWQQVTRELLNALRARGIPVLLLDQASSLMPGEEYLRLKQAYPGAEYLSVRALLSASPSQAERDFFSRQVHWLEEFSPRTRAFILKFDRSSWYRGDILQLNRLGYRKIAENLAPILQRMLH